MNININELTLGQIKEIQNIGVSCPPTAPLSKNEYEKYVGNSPTLYCMNYIYTGELDRVEGGSLVFKEGGKIVYNTGDHSSASWEDAEKMPNEWSVTIQSIESHGYFK